MIELTQELVREFLDYDPDTGVLIWKERDVVWFKDGKRSAERACNIWNGQRAGKVAGTLQPNGYIYISILGRLYLAHRIIWFFMTGEFPSDAIDHINGVKDDNRWCNLRAVTYSENMKNQGMRNDNTSGFKGVSWRKQIKKWEAYINIKVDGKSKRKLLGYFDTPEEASKAYISSATEAGYTDRHIFGKD